MARTSTILSGMSLVLLLSLISSRGFANAGGAVCLGPNLMFAPYIA
jgi:hypothetical protein